MKTIQILIFLFLTLLLNLQSFAQANDSESAFLNWNQKTAQSIGESWREKGRVGGFFDTRILDTSSSYNYKLRATLMSPQAIRASARLEQIRNRLSNDETLKLVDEADQEHIVIIVEIEPREGSGIIPNDWRAFIGAKNSVSDKLVAGKLNNDLRNRKGLQTIFKRDYDYDIFWVSFSLFDENGKPLWDNVPEELELVVGIKEKEGRVNWKVTNDLKVKLENILKSKLEK